MSRSKSEKWIALSDVQRKTQEFFGDKPVDLNDLDPSQYLETRRFYSENPLSITNFRFPANANGAPTIDLDRIQASQNLLRVAKFLAHTVGHDITEFNGGGSSYDETISGRNVGGILTATAAKRKLTKPPAAPRGELIFPPEVDTDNKTRHGVYGTCRSIAQHALNRDAIDERIDELKENPKREMTDSEAWATALDENFRRSMILRSRKSNIVSTGYLLTMFESFAYKGIASSPENYKKYLEFAWYWGTDLAVTYGTRKFLISKAKKIDAKTTAAANETEATGESDNETPEIPMSAAQYYDEITAPREWNISLFSPHAIHIDKHLALAALMNASTLIRYRK
ncbi:hypothetical protein FWF74_03405 [Candidatus Saccharibacteria bacterium]|nr:hypothetical protein [Candidatus Saccharibacteria bacterium]